MGEFFLVVGVLFLTAIIFIVWLCVRVAGLIIRAIVGPRRTQGSAGMAVNDAICANPRCRARNAHHARFCSRCGSPAGAGRMRYVA